MLVQGNTSKAGQLLEQGLQLTWIADEPLAASVCLEALAWIAATDNRMSRAAVLAGAAEGLGRAVGSSSSVLFHNLQKYHDKCKQLTRKALGDREFETLLRKGNHLDLQEAVAFALGTDSSAEK
ncbi:hypothetical protein [Tomitella biformata]|uniref:hypothetical protein n=1 Tax=Tomitella biformata TaxID=630403 RepID=UPI000466C719|nr:hypothetical protein [Tomitella biformata]